MQIEFELYVFVYLGKTNTIKGRSVPDIAIKVSNNFVGAYFMYLYTAKRLHSCIREEISIDSDVIRRVE